MTNWAIDPGDVMVRIKYDDWACNAYCNTVTCETTDNAKIKVTAGKQVVIIWGYGFRCTKPSSVKSTMESFKKKWIVWGVNELESQLVNNHHEVQDWREEARRYHNWYE